MTNVMYCKLNKLVYRAIPGELKHLSTRRKRKKIDFLSSGERKGKSPNQELVPGVADRSEILKFFNRRELEGSAIEGNSPVGEKKRQTDLIQSTTRHVKPCGKQGGPPPKAKY
jgi:hypothetical protein